MNRIPAVVLLSLLAGAMAGCGSPQMSRIDKNRDVYETWPIEVRQAVLDGKVEQGMTPEMVKVAWGKPSEVVGDGSIGDEIWVYRTGGSEGTVMYPGSGGIYPGAAGYPGGMYPGTGNSVGIVSGPGGTGMTSSSNVGIGLGNSGSGLGVMGPGIGNSGMGGMGGMSSPVYIPPTPGETKEVVFRNGVVYRADVP
jgi:hypothetical protein